MATSPRPRHRAPTAAAVVAATVVSVLGGCTVATPDPALTDTTTTSPVTTTTLPTGTAAELLPLLVAEATSLAGVMIAEGDDRAVVERMVALWAAVTQEVGVDRPDLLASFDASIALAEEAVQFRRAADADKASKNLTALVDAYLSR